MSPSRPPPRPSVLLTGFAPFGGDLRNPSLDAVHALQDTQLAGHRIVTRVLPVEFGTALHEMRRALRETQPALVVAVGLAASRQAISLERIAINIDDARIPDNAGRQPVDAPVVPGGPAAHFTTLPIKAMHAALREMGIPAEVSQTAGTFVCNHVFYGLMHALRRRRHVRGGFIHVPHALETAGIGTMPAMPLSIIIEALRIAVGTALSVEQDLPHAAGAID